MCLLIYVAVGIFTCKAPRALFWICALHKYSLLLLLLLLLNSVIENAAGMENRTSINLYISLYYLPCLYTEQFSLKHLLLHWGTTNL